MRLRKRKWMDSLLEESAYLLKEDDVEEFLKRTQNLVLEIGSGKGKFLLEMARKNPECEFLGVEIQRSALAISIKTIGEEKRNNLHFICSDIQKLFFKFSDESLNAIYLNFSDPWPKKRQQKRRLTYPSFLKEYYRLLKRGGKLYFKTDNEDLFSDSLHYLKDSSFILESMTMDYNGEDSMDALTDYEIKFRSQEKKITRFVARKGE